jgi:hypothetical protein
MHAFWDALLIFSPPLWVALYLTVYFQKVAWIAPMTSVWVGATVVGVGVLAVVIRVRSLIPSVGSVARMVDEKTKAKDRFLTLATIDGSLWPSSLVARLRSEAAASLQGIDFRREFAYRIKRSFYWSLLGSIIAAASFHLLLLGSSARQVPPAQTLNELSERMALEPALSTLAQGLQALALKLQEAGTSEEEKQTLIHQTLKQVEEQRKSEDQENRDLLNQALNTLQGLEQQSSRGQQKDSEAGEGSLASNLSQKGQGEGKQNQGEGNDGKGESNTQRSEGIEKGKSTQADPKESGHEKSERNQADAKGDQLDRSKTEAKDSGSDSRGKTPGGAEKLGRNQSEEIPQGMPPAERFHKPGEKTKEGVKGARYITVQLPEELAAESKSEGTRDKQSKEAKAYPKGPASNIPLPAHAPDAPAEKQPLPLEYRGIIR